MIKKQDKVPVIYLLYSFVSNELTDNKHNINILGLYNNKTNGEQAFKKELETKCIKDINDNSWFYKERNDLIDNKTIKLVEVFYDYIGNYENYYYLILEKVDIKDEEIEC